MNFFYLQHLSFVYFGAVADIVVIADVGVFLLTVI